MRDAIKDLSLDQPLRRIQDEPVYEKIQEIIDAFSLIVDEDSNKGEATWHHFTVELDDPSGNSFIEFYDSMADPQWSMRDYKRTPEQNQELGIGGPPAESASQPGDATISAEEILVFPGSCPSCGKPVNTLMKKTNIPHFKVQRFRVGPFPNLVNRDAGNLHHVHELRGMWLQG